MQGEIIEQQFGEREVCFRALDLYTSAVLEACLDPPPAPKQVCFSTCILCVRSELATMMSCKHTQGTDLFLTRYALYQLGCSCQPCKDSNANAAHSHSLTGMA